MATPASFSLTNNPAVGSGIKLIQQNVNGNESGTSNLSVSFTSNNTAGDFLIVTGSAARPASTLSISDTLGNSYLTAFGPVTDATQDVTIYIWYVPICKGGANTVTITPSVTAALEIHVSEWSGLASTSPVDQTASATGTGTSVSSGAKTTTINGELVFGYGWVFNTASAGTGFTPISLLNGDLDEYQIQPAAGSIAATFTQTSGTWFAALVTFKPVGWSISGAITGAGAVTVTLSGPTGGTTTTDASGNYSFSALANGSYTVTPSKTGFTFNPTSLVEAVSGANISNVNFTASPAPLWSISGAITGGAGALVTLSGASSGTVTADSSGNYTFNGLINGTYTVTPSESGFSFTPPSQMVVVNGASVPGVNFTASGTTPVLSVSPQTLSFTAALGGSNPAPSSISVTNSGTGTLNYTAGSDSSWLGVSPVSGTAPQSLQATVSITGLAAGNYTGHITIAASGAQGSPVIVTVTLLVTGTGTLSIDATVSKDNNSASTTIVSSAFSTVSGNELLLAFVGSDYQSSQSSTNVSVTGVSGGGLTWALVKKTNTQLGTAEIWRAFAPLTLSNITVTATLSQSVQSSMTVMSFIGVDTTGTNGSGAIGAIGGGSAATGAPTATLVTTRNNSWVVGAGTDYDNAIARTVGTGQTLVHQDLSPINDTYWVQRQSSATALSGTSVTINDTAPTTDRYNLSIAEVLPSSNQPPIPDLTITKSHSGNFVQGQMGAQYTITVTNSGGAATSGTVTMTDTLPASLTATAISGTNWSCTLATLTCTRSDALAAGGSYPAITLTVNVAGNAPVSITNTATVSGGGETNISNDAANDLTTVTAVGGLIHVGGAPGHPVVTNQVMTFNYTPVGTNDAVVILIGCRSPGVTSMSLTATGWTFTPISGLVGPSGFFDFISTFGAITPNTAPATFTVTLGGGNGNCTGNDTTVLVDEFSGNDITGGTTTFDAHNESLDTSGGTICTGAPVTPANNNDAIWYACFDNVTGVNNGYVKGQDDTTGDWSEYKILSGGLGVAQNPGFVTNPSFFSFGLGGVSIKAALGGGAPTHSLSGTITPAANGSGATVSLSGSSTATVTADNNGNFSFTGLANGNYTVTPSKTGYTFSPVNQSVTVNGVNQTGVNFTAQGAASWNISGTIGATGCNGCSYVQSTRSSQSGHTDWPTLLNVKAGDALVYFGEFSNWTPGATVNMSDSHGNTWHRCDTNDTSDFVEIQDQTTNGMSCQYTINIAAWQTISAQPVASQCVSISCNQVGGAFFELALPATATATAWATPNAGTSASGSNNVSCGSITLTQANDFLMCDFNNASGTPTAGTTPVPFTMRETVVTAIETGLYSGVGTITPTGTLNTSGIAYTGFAAAFSATTGGAGITVALSGASSATTVTDTNGNYLFSGLANGSYTVAPSKTGYTFSPANQSVTVNGANQTGVNFTAQSAGSSWSISGAISPAASGSGAMVKLTGPSTAIVTADSNGNFVFTGLANGAYVVTPTKSGFTFNPASQNVSVSGVNVAGILFAAQTIGPSSIKLVQSNVNGNEAGTSNMSVSFNTNITAGNFLIVSGTAARPASTLSISDTLGNTYAVAMGPVTDTVPNVTVYIWYVANCKGGANTVTLTPSGTAALEIHVSEWSGLATTSPVDQIASNTGTGASVSSGPQTTAINGELVFGFGWVFNTASAGAGFTPISLVNGDLDEYQIQPAAGSIAATFTQTSGTWFAALVTFKPAGGTSGNGLNVSMVSPVLNAIVTSMTNVSASATDQSNSITGIQFLLDGNNLGAQVTSAPYSIAWDTTTATAGTHALSAIAHDSAGLNTTAATLTVAVDNSGSPAVVGSWSSAVSTPAVAVNLILLKNNKLLFYQDGSTSTVWDYVNNIFTNIPTSVDLFCSGQTALSDGRILMIGGYGGSSTQIGIPLSLIHI